MPLTTEQIENIQIDYGIIYKNFGEVGEALLGPTRGGGEFIVSKNIREIEYDGRRGKTKGMQVIDEMNAVLKVTTLDASMDMLALALPFVTYSASVLTGEAGNVGVIDDSAYLTNITMFAKLISGDYKKITLYNSMNEGDLTLKATPKGEAEIALEINAHWDPADDTADLFQIEDVASISGDTSGPTVVTVPADAADNIIVSANLTATFSEAVKAADINSNNFILMKAADGTIVPGSLSYDAATKVATFDPTANLSAGADYIWVISNVRDTAGNKMAPVSVNFTTAS